MRHQFNLMCRQVPFGHPRRRTETKTSTVEEIFVRLPNFVRGALNNSTQEILLRFARSWDGKKTGLNVTQCVKIVEV
jgi:hypothetical protein